MAALEDAQRACDRLARGADEFPNLPMREGKAEMRTALGGLAVLAPFEQQASQFFGRRVGQPHSAQLLTGHGVVAAQLLGHDLVDLGMAREEVEKIPPQEDRKSV